MPHQALDDAGRDASGIGQSGDLKSQGMEVEEQTGCIHVRGFRGFQVGPMASPQAPSG